MTKPRPRDPFTDAWQARALRARLRAEPTYLRYLRAVWRSSAAFGYYATGLSFFRRVRLFRLIARILHTVLMILESGTLLLLLLPFLLVFLPGTVILLAFMSLGGWWELRRTRRRMEERMRGKTVLFLHADASQLGSSPDASFMRGCLLSDELTAPEDRVILVCSPYLLSAQGFGRKGFYWAYRREAKNVYLIRTLAYFSLRRSALACARKVIVVA